MEELRSWVIPRVGAALPVNQAGLAFTATEPLYKGRGAAALTHTNRQHGPPQPPSTAKSMATPRPHTLLPSGNRNSTAPRGEQICKEDIVGYLFQASITSSPKESSKQCQLVLHATDLAPQMIKVQLQTQGGQNCILLRIYY